MRVLFTCVDSDPENGYTLNEVSGIFSGKRSGNFKSCVNKAIKPGGNGNDVTIERTSFGGDAFAHDGRAYVITEEGGLCVVRIYNDFHGNLADIDASSANFLVYGIWNSYVPMYKYCKDD